jgi:hypothetical protein
MIPLPRCSLLPAGRVRRSGRRQRLATSFGVADQLVGAGVLAAPERALATLTGHAAALSLLAASPVAGHLDRASLQGVALLVAIVAAARGRARGLRGRALALAGVDGRVVAVPPWWLPVLGVVR